MKTLKNLFFLLVFLSTVSFLDAQPPESGDQYLKEYNRRIKKETINDIYIPKDLTDAFKELNRLTDKAARTKLIQVDEDTVAYKTYFSLQRWIVVNWGFHGGSRLSHWLKTEIGVSHPEDQAQFIVRTWHRSLNKKELNIEELVKQLNEKRTKERVKNKVIIKSEKRKVPKPEDSEN